MIELEQQRSLLSNKPSQQFGAKFPPTDLKGLYFIFGSNYRRNVHTIQLFSQQRSVIIRKNIGECEADRVRTEPPEHIPVVTLSLPKVNSSATRPPRATSISANSWFLVRLYWSFSGIKAVCGKSNGPRLASGRLFGS